MFTWGITKIYHIADVYIAMAYEHVDLSWSIYIYRERERLIDIDIYIYIYRDR